MANNEKIISQSVFEQAVKDILIELVNSTYSWESYSDEEIGNLVELDPTQVAELSAVISHTQVAKNKVFSSFHTKELLQENLIEANKYSDDLVANLSNIKLDIVDSLPDSSTVNKSTIYILKDSSGGTNNTLNVWSDSASAFVEVGKLNVNMNNYYTKSEVDAELAKKANADEVLSADAIVSDLTTTSGSTTLSTAGLQTELDKKVGKSAILSAVSATPSEEKVLSEKAVKTELDKKIDKTSIATSIDSSSTDTQVASAKAVYDKYEEANVYKGRYNGDLNDIPFIKSGTVYKYDIRRDTSTNMPINTHGVLYSTYFDSENYCLQEYHSLEANRSSIYRRNKESGTWKEWVKVDVTITNLAQLGLTAPCSVGDICKALPTNTRFAMVVSTSSTITDIPKSYGMLTIDKFNYCTIMYRCASWGSAADPADTYLGSIKNSDYTGGVVWKKLYATGISDTPKTLITISDETNYKNSPGSESFYVIRGGICYVTLAVDCVSPLSNTIISTLPKAYGGIFRFSMAHINGRMDGYVLQDGTLKLSGGAAGVKYYVCSFSYPVAES